MPEVDGTCKYVLDPDEPETWGGEEGERCAIADEVLNENGVWDCPHIQANGEDLCIFHLPFEKKDDGDAFEAFLDKVFVDEAMDDEEKNNHVHRFINSRFGKFDLSKRTITLETKSEINLSYSDINGEFNCKRAEFEIGQFYSKGVHFNDDVVFDNAIFNCEVDLFASDIEGVASFNWTHFHNTADFIGAKFNRGVSFREAKFEDAAHFGHTEFNHDTHFYKTIFCGVAKFSDAVFKHQISFENSEFRDEVNFNETLSSGADFEGDACFDNSEFRNKVDFSGLDFSKEVSFENVVFHSESDFTDSIINRANFTDSDLTDANFAGTVLQDTVFESCLLSRATLFGADLRGAKLAGAVLGDVRIDEDTKFLGHPSDDVTKESSIGDTLSKLLSGQYCVYDPRYKEEGKTEDIDSAKSVYRALEELGGIAARPHLQSQSFVNRQDLQRKQYWDGIGESDNPLDWLVNSIKWSRAKVAQKILLYGESPWRVISWSLGIILGFALLFPLGGWMQPEEGDPITYTQIASNPVEILNSVYYSTLTYTALGFGDFRPVGLGKALTTVETGLGAVMLALLVFILGRRAAR